MNKWAIRLVAVSSFVAIGTELQAHHAVASAYDLNKEIVLQGTLLKLNFANPHSNLHLSVPNADGTIYEWVLTTASTQVLTSKGFNKSSIKPGDPLKINCSAGEKMATRPDSSASSRSATTSSSSSTTPATTSRHAPGV